MCAKKIILFNGPPRAGKDTASEFVLSENANCRLVKITEAVKNKAHKDYNLNVSHDFFEPNKDTPLDVFSGKTPREVYIETSETLREIHGENIVIEMFMDTVKSTDHDVIINPDIGYDFEAAKIIEEFGVENILLVRIHRDGKNFDNDCRNWIFAQGVKDVDILNSDMETFRNSIREAVAEFINPEPQLSC